MDSLLDYNLQKKLSHPLFESVSIGLMALAWGLFVFSAESYRQANWYNWLFYSRFLMSVSGFLLLGIIISKELYHKNLSAVYLTFSIAIQASHGILEGSRSVDFHNFTGLIFVLAALSYNGLFVDWVMKFIPGQISFILLPLLTKDSSYFSSFGIFLDSFSLMVSGVIIGIAAAYLTSSRYKYMKGFLLERQEKYNLAKQVEHDLKSPLLSARILLSDVSKLEGDDLNTFKMLMLRMESVVEGLGHVSKSADSYNLLDRLHSLQFEKVNLYCSHHGLRLDFRIDPNLKNFHAANLDHFFTAISNVIDNAVQATRYCGEVDVEFLLSDGNVIAKITDNGPGIPLDVVDKIFDHGFSFNKSNGSGLGLHQAKKAVECLSGSLSLVGNSEKGASFEIRIPAL